MDLKSLKNEDGLDSLKNNIISENIESSKQSSEKNIDDLFPEDHKTFSMSDVDITDATVEPIQPVSQYPESPKSSSPDIVEGDTVVTDPKSHEVSNMQDDSGVRLENIQIEEQQEVKKPTFSFEDDKKEVQEKSPREQMQGIFNMKFSGRSMSLYIVAIVLLFVFVLGSLGLYFTEKYVRYKTQPQETLTEYQSKIIETIDGYRDMLGSTGLIDITPITPPTKVVSANELRNAFADTSISYIQKYDYTKANMDLLNRRVPKLAKELTKTREELSNYPFFPREIQNIIKADDDYSLQRSLLSLEGVKLRTALSVFSRLGSFIDDFAIESGKNREEILAFIEKIIARGDVDIDTYLRTCYMNPYEKPEVCTQYGDFARTYNMRKGPSNTGEAIQTTLFARMMGFMDKKLEFSDVPSLSLSVTNFDPHKQKLTLDLSVNTLPEDALQLYKQGVLNPHIYVVSNMINFLRQSKFIISKDITINELAIKTIMVELGSKEIPVTTSNFSFDLPLQKGTEREITDFYYKKIKNITPQKSDITIDDITNITGSTQNNLSGDQSINENVNTLGL